MTRYVLRVPEMPDRVLFVRKWYNGSWTVGQLPINLRDRHYPNYDEKTARLFWCYALTPSDTAEEMQEKLDVYAKKCGLEVWEDENFNGESK